MAEQVLHYMEGMLDLGPYGGPQLPATVALQEFKTDLDLTRLPSGKFDTKALVCRPAALAMNMLRPLCQRGC